MNRSTLPLICAVAAFILIYDDQKLIHAKTIEKRATTYTTRFDNIDIDRIVGSRRLMQNYANCLLEKGPCTPEGKELKIYMPDAMQTKCAKCSEKQKQIAGKILAHLVQNHKDLWDELLTKYDTDGSFRKEYEGSDDYEEEEE